MSEQAQQATNDFIVTKEYRCFAEFCDACRRYRYIGLCYGQPGVGKTLSARHYAQWDLFEAQLPRKMVEYPPPELIPLRILLYTPSVTTTPRRIEKDVAQLRLDLTVLTDGAS